MARFHGIVGYGSSVEEATDVYVDEIVEIEYFGDVIRSARRIMDGENLSDDVIINNSISIVADEYANNNFIAIKFVEWMGTAWTVDSVEVKSPRLLLTLGRVYNGPRAG
jgi:hypothetical protein